MSNTRIGTSLAFIANLLLPRVALAPMTIELKYYLLIAPAKRRLLGWTWLPRLIELESNNGFQESELLDMCKAIVDGHACIETFETTVRALREKLKEVAEGASLPFPRTRGRRTTDFRIATATSSGHSDNRHMPFRVLGRLLRVRDLHRGLVDRVNLRGGSLDEWTVIVTLLANKLTLPALRLA